MLETTLKGELPKVPVIIIGSGYKSYPYEMTLLDLSSNEAKMFKLIRQAYDNATGLSVVDLSNHTPSQRNKLSNGYKALKSRQLVKRVKQKVYMINPQAVVNLPLCSELYEQWKKL